MSALHDQAARRTALENFDDNLVLVAGAGSGKTSLMVSRILCALIGKELESSELLVTTFTEKAAGEMSERLDEALRKLADETLDDDGGSDAGRARDALRDFHGLNDAEIARRARAVSLQEAPSVETFHAFCLRWLQEFARPSELPPEVEICTGLDEALVFEEFWPAFLHDELGRRHTEEHVDRAWDTLLEHFELREVSALARSWCLQPELRECKIDWSHASLADATSENTLFFESDPVLETSTRKLVEWLRQAVQVARRLLALGDEDLPVRDDLREDLEELVAAKIARPAKGDYPDAARLEEVKQRSKLLRAQLEAWSKLPDPELARAIDTLIARASHSFAQFAAARGTLSFSECLVRCENLLRTRPRVRQRLRDRYSMLIVDEFQDTDPLQYEILFYLAQEGATAAHEDPYEIPLRRGSLCIVGDPKQSIYRFRGADMRAYRRAIERIESQGGQVLGLDVNFRSEAEVLDFVNRAIGPDFLERSSPAGAPPLEDAREDYQARRQNLHCPREARGLGRVTFLHVDALEEPDGRSRCAREAREIGRMIRDRMRARAADGIRYRDYALLFRAATEIETYARELRSLGLPVLVEGGKRFYQRREVERFVALLRLAAYPWDASAALTCLRGPLGAVPDDELFRVAEASRVSRKIPAPTRWIATGFVDLELAPELSVAAQNLATHAREILARPVDEALDFALYETGLASIEAAGWDGTQRLANVEALVQRVSAWARQGAHDLASAVVRFEREAFEQADAEESPLADTHSDAIRLMTIHKSKGLEWDSVIIPDARRSLVHRQKRKTFVRDQRGHKRALATHEVAASPSLPDFVLDEERHEEAERTRLCYVAATRAKRELLFSWTPPTKAGRSLWRDIASRVGVDLHTAPEGAVDLGACIHHDVRPAAEDSEAANAAEVLTPAYKLQPAALRERVAHDKALESSMRAPLRAASSQDHESHDGAAIHAARTKDLGMPSQRRDSATAARVGTIVHEYLRRSDTDEKGIDAQLLSSLVRSQARAQDRAARRKIERNCQEILERTLESPLGETLRHARVVGRELPVLWTDDDGKRWHGSIDLVLEDEGEIVVVDYKTDNVRAGGEAAFLARHATQIRRYADGIRSAWNLGHEPRCELWLLRKAERLRLDQ